MSIRIFSRIITISRDSCKYVCLTTKFSELERSPFDAVKAAPLSGILDRSRLIFACSIIEPRNLRTSRTILSGIVFHLVHNCLVYFPFFRHLGRFFRIFQKTVTNFGICFSYCGAILYLLQTFQPPHRPRILKFSGQIPCFFMFAACIILFYCL